MNHKISFLLCLACIGLTQNVQTAETQTALPKELKEVIDKKITKDIAKDPKIIKTKKDPSDPKEMRQIDINIKEIANKIIAQYLQNAQQEKTDAVFNALNYAIDKLWETATSTALGISKKDIKIFIDPLKTGPVRIFSIKNNYEEVVKEHKKAEGGMTNHSKTAALKLIEYIYYRILKNHEAEVYSEAPTAGKNEKDTWEKRKDALIKRMQNNKIINAYVDGMANSSLNLDGKKKLHNAAATELNQVQQEIVNFINLLWGSKGAVVQLQKAATIGMVIGVVVVLPITLSVAFFTEPLEASDFDKQKTLEKLSSISGYYTNMFNQTANTGHNDWSSLQVKDTNGKRIVTRNQKFPELNALAEDAKQELTTNYVRRMLVEILAAFNTMYYKIVMAQLQGELFGHTLEKTKEETPSFWFSDNLNLFYELSSLLKRTNTSTVEGASLEKKYFDLLETIENQK